MDKRRLGPQHFLNPKPVVLLGTIVDEKPNFLTVSWIGSACANPPAIVAAVRNKRYSLKGIRQHRTFSLNFPTVDMAGVADYCGSVSGATVDKVKACSLIISAGNLRAAPLIDQSPIIWNAMCRNWSKSAIIPWSSVRFVRLMLPKIAS